MPLPIHSLDRIRITTPCDADWDSMVGNDQVRFCRHCDLHVSDLNAMTRGDAMRLVARSQGRLCLRYVARPDGGMVATQTPQLYRIGRRVSRLAAGAFTAAMSLSSAVAQAPAGSLAGESCELPVLSHDDRKKEVINDDFRASVSGKIKDADGKAIQGAQVILVNQESGEESLITANGKYLFQSLPAGDYLVWARLPGFRTVRNKIELPKNQRARFDVVLELSETISGMSGGVSGMIEPQDPLVKAVAENDSALAASLIASTRNLDRNDNSTNMSALAQAVERGNRGLVQLLLAAGANVNARSSGGKTPIMFLSNDASVDLVRDLIGAGAKTNMRDDYGTNALMAAAWSGPPAVVRELIDAGTMMTATDAGGETALLAAARFNTAPVIEMLIAAGANINATNEDGQTALMLAAPEGYDKVKLLIASGAEINAQDHEGKAVLMYATSNDDPQIVRLLLDQGAKIDAKTQGDMTALMFAAAQGAKPEVIKMLIEAGAGVNQADVSGSTALMYAAERGTVEVLNVLLEQNADLDLKNEAGKTALMLAVEANDEASVAALLSKGANLSATDKEGKTALHLALDQDDEKIIELLKARGASR
jgi:ankyrin repeat protein